MLSGNIIAVTSGKGGVGKSTVSVNLALSFARMGKQVALIDLDIYGFSVPKILNITSKPRTMNGKIIPVESHGIKVMSMGFLVNGNDPVVWRGPMLGKMVEHFSNDVLWGKLDYVILDLPPGTGDIALDMHHFIPQSKEIIVTTPHPTATHVASRAGTMAIKTNHEILGVVENMAFFQPPGDEKKYFLFGKGGGDELAEQFSSRVIARLPIEPVEAGQVPSSVYSEGSVLFQHYKELADTIDKMLND